MSSNPSPAGELNQLLAEASSALAQARSSQELDQVKAKFLGRKSRLATIMKETPHYK